MKAHLVKTIQSTKESNIPKLLTINDKVKLKNSSSIIRLSLKLKLDMEHTFHHSTLDSGIVDDFLTDYKIKLSSLLEEEKLET